MKLESMQLPPSDRHNQTLLKKVRPLFLQTPRFVAAPCLVPSQPYQTAKAYEATE